MTPNRDCLEDSAIHKSKNQHFYAEAEKLLNYRYTVMKELERFPSLNPLLQQKCSVCVTDEDKKTFVGESKQIRKDTERFLDRLEVLTKAVEATVRKKQ